MSLPKSRMVRTVQPDDFFDEILMDAERTHQLPVRVIYIALHTMADREGRFTWDGKTMRYLSLDEPAVIESVLDVLHKIGKVTRYRVGEHDYGVINDFTRKQHINPREKQSVLPMIKGSKLLQAAAKPVVVNPVDEVSLQSDVPAEVVNSGSAAEINEAEHQGKDNSDVALELAEEADLKSTSFTVTKNGFIYKRRPSLGLWRYTENKNDNPVLVVDVEDVSPVICTFPLIKSDVPELGISEGRARVYDEIYPMADNVARVKSAAFWLMDNPAKRKTPAGITKFLGAWMQSAQNKNQNLLPSTGVATTQKPRTGLFANRLNPDERTKEVTAQMKEMFGRRDDAPVEHEVRGVTM